MKIFTRKKVSSEKSLGEILKEERTKNHYGLLYISQILKIPTRYLKALEESQYSELPSEIYARNFLKAYCKFLKIEIKECLEKFNLELVAFQKIGKSKIDSQLPPEKTSRWSFLITPKIVKALVIVLILLISFTYLGVKIEGIFSPPTLVVTSPQVNLVVKDPLIEIKGQAEIGSNIMINQRQVLPDDLGFFEEVINLKEGINIIEITARKRYSRDARIERIIQVVK